MSAECSSVCWGGGTRLRCLCLNRTWRPSGLIVAEEPFALCLIELNTSWVNTSEIFIIPQPSGRQADIRGDSVRAVSLQDYAGKPGTNEVQRLNGLPPGAATFLGQIWGSPGRQCDEMDHAAADTALQPDGGSHFAVLCGSFCLFFCLKKKCWLRNEPC